MNFPCESENIWFWHIFYISIEYDMQTINIYQKPTGKKTVDVIHWIEITKWNKFVDKIHILTTWNVNNIRNMFTKSEWQSIKNEMFILLIYTYHIVDLWLRKTFDFALGIHFFCKFSPSKGIFKRK